MRYGKTESQRGLDEERGGGVHKGSQPLIVIPVSEAIRIIELGMPFDDEIKEYREMQLKFLRKIQNGEI